MTNGEVVKREWLIYSKKHDSIFCFCCLIFGSESSSFKTGFKDWFHLTQAVKTHEHSNSHVNSFECWKDHLKRLCSNSTIELSLDKQLLDEKKRLKLVFERLVAMTLYLARQNIAFAGTDSKSGNFYELAQTISEFDVVMKSHLESNARNKYLTPASQNDFINAIGVRIRDTILNRIKESKYYSIILDCTPDVSHQEQMTIIFRYVFFDTKKREYQVEERFIEFITVADKTGEGITELIKQELDIHQIDIMDMRSQGYDNGRNMQGKHKGVQQRIREVNPLAVYIPCTNHSLNLSLNDVASASIDVSRFFSIVQHFFTFLSASTNRWDILKKHCQLPSDLAPKSISETRWSARYEAVKPLRRNLNEIVKSLDEISDSELFTNSTRQEASSIADQVDFKFIVSICIWYDILERFDRVSKLLQSIGMNIGSAVFLLRDLKKFLNDYASNGYDKAINVAMAIALEMNVPVTFETRKRGRPVESMTAEQHFKTNFFEYLVETAKASIAERFDAFSEHAEIFSFLYETEFIEERYNNGELLPMCMKLEQALSHNGKSDIDGNELCSELRIVGKMLKENSIEQIIDVINLIVKKQLETILPNTLIAYRILLTTAVSVASGERSFSKLKIIKTYLRNRTGQERLSNLAIISIEKDLTEILDYNDVVQDFANVKSRKFGNL